MSFPSKMTGTPKKIGFLPFHVLHTPPQDRKTDIVLFGNKMVKMAKGLTLHKSAHCFFPGKNRIRKIREKSGYNIFVILGQISRMDTINDCFMV